MAFPSRKDIIIDRASRSTFLGRACAIFRRAAIRRLVARLRASTPSLRGDARNRHVSRNGTCGASKFWSTCDDSRAAGWSMAHRQRALGRSTAPLPRCFAEPERTPHPLCGGSPMYCRTKFRAPTWTHRWDLGAPGDAEGTRARKSGMDQVRSLDALLARTVLRPDRSRQDGSLRPLCRLLGILDVHADISEDGKARRQPRGEWHFRLGAGGPRHPRDCLDRGRPRGELRHGDAGGRTSTPTAPRLRRLRSQGSTAWQIQWTDPSHCRTFLTMIGRALMITISCNWERGLNGPSDPLEFFRRFTEKLIPVARRKSSGRQWREFGGLNVEFTARRRVARP